MNREVILFLSERVSLGQLSTVDIEMTRFRNYVSFLTKENILQLASACSIVDWYIFGGGSTAGAVCMWVHSGDDKEVTDGKVTISDGSLASLASLVPDPPKPLSRMHRSHMTVLKVASGSLELWCEYKFPTIPPSTFEIFLAYSVF